MLPSALRYSAESWLIGEGGSIIANLLSRWPEALLECLDLSSAGGHLQVRGPDIVCAYRDHRKPIAGMSLRLEELPVIRDGIVGRSPAHRSILLDPPENWLFRHGRDDGDLERACQVDLKLECALHSAFYCTVYAGEKAVEIGIGGVGREHLPAMAIDDLGAAFPKPQDLLLEQCGTTPAEAVDIDHAAECCPLCPNDRTYCRDHGASVFLTGEAQVAHRDIDFRERCLP